MRLEAALLGGDDTPRMGSSGTGSGDRPSPPQGARLVYRFMDQACDGSGPAAPQAPRRPA
jgi:hypothetical protein